MRIELSGTASSWQEALEPHLDRLRGFYWSCTRGWREQEDWVQEALGWACRDAQAHWRPGKGLTMCATFHLRSIRDGRRSSMMGTGYPRVQRSVKARRLASWARDGIRGREQSPPQAAIWHELLARLPDNVRRAAELLGAGDTLASVAKHLGRRQPILRKEMELVAQAYAVREK